MPSSELVISINQQDELPYGYTLRNFAQLKILSHYLESLPDWAMQYFSQTDLKDEDLPDAYFVPGDEYFPASVIISALELKTPEFRQAFIDNLTEEFRPLLETLPLLYLSFQTPVDEGF